MTFEFYAPDINLDKIAASGQCFRWTPAPGGGYIVPTAGLCATLYRLDGKVLVHEHTISGGHSLTPEVIAARGWWNRYLDNGVAYRRY